MKLPRVLCLHRTKDSFTDQDIHFFFLKNFNFKNEDIQRNFRFCNKEQLRRDIVCFQLPERFRSMYRHVFRAEELLLVCAVLFTFSS